MRVLSLFSGIGGFDLGLERAGMEIVGQVEIDEYCSKILKHHWPAIPQWRDIRAATAKDIRRRCGRIDLICGGFPCQDISAAGRGAGLNGPQSRLWWEMWRLVRELRPDWILIENSPNLRTRGGDTVFISLEAIDYTCWPFVVAAEDAGAPHERKRVITVAHRNSDRLQGSGVSAIARQAVHNADGAGAPLGDGDSTRCQGGAHERIQAQIAQSADTDDQVADGRCPGTRLSARRRCGTCGQEAIWPFPAGQGSHQHDWEAARLVSKSALEANVYGFSARLARREYRQGIKASGNSVVPQVVEAIGKAIIRLAAQE